MKTIIARLEKYIGAKALGVLCTGLILSSSALPAVAQNAGAPAIQSITVEGLAAYTDTIPGTVVTFKMLPIPGGKRTVNTLDGPKEVEVKPFYMSETEVTWDAFDIYAYGLDLQESGEEPGSDGIIRPSKPYGAPDRGFGHQGYAALSMSYGVGTEYARWLAQKTGKNYRLATEAEWEIACAGNNGAADSAPITDRAWVAENSENKTQPVATKQPNSFGLYDMLGNALEWCTQLNEDAEVPVACGGSYLTPGEGLGCGYRERQTPAWQETDPQIPKSVFWLTDATWIGFRIVAEP